MLTSFQRVLTSFQRLLQIQALTFPMFLNKISTYGYSDLGYHNTIKTSNHKALIEVTLSISLFNILY